MSIKSKLAIPIILIAACQMKTQPLPADLIIYNGSIQTVNDSLQVVSALAITDGKITALGSDSAILAQYSSEEIINLEGKNALPGLIDPHCHFYGYGLTLRHANLTGTSSWADVIEKLQAHQKANPSHWVLGRGWDQNDWETTEYPTNHLLNQLYPNQPVVLTRIDGHAIIANQAALEIAGITEKTIIPGGELIIKDGILTGVLIDNAADSMKVRIPDATPNEQRAALIRAQKNCFAVGLTSVGDAGLKQEVISMMDSMQKSHELKMRVYAMVEGTPENMAPFLATGPTKTDRLSVRSVKFYADGALGSRGAKLLEPYHDQHNHKGLLVHPENELRLLFKKASDAGFQICTHCIGDGAVRMVLNLYGELLPKENDNRWRIEHAQVVNPADMERFAQWHVIPSVQPTHATSDMYWANKRLGPVRVQHAYAYQNLLKTNGWLPNGSDFPIENINPIFGFYAAVARKDQKGYPEEGFQMENRLTREQALRAMTIWAAKAQFEENEKGSLEVGKMADLVVLDRDILSSDEGNLFDTKVVLTMIGGEVVFEQCDINNKLCHTSKRTLQKNQLLGLLKSAWNHKRR